MSALWTKGSPATVREVYEELTEETPLAYTTVMTVMERLWRKSFLQRTPAGGTRAFAYSPTKGEAEFTAERMSAVLEGSVDRPTALAHFLRDIPKDSEAELLKIADEVRRRKRRR